MGRKSVETEVSVSAEVSAESAEAPVAEVSGDVAEAAPTEITLTRIDLNLEPHLTTGVRAGMVLIPADKMAELSQVTITARAGKGALAINKSICPFVDTGLIDAATGNHICTLVGVSEAAERAGLVDRSYHALIAQLNAKQVTPRAPAKLDVDVAIKRLGNTDVEALRRLQEALAAQLASLGG